MQSLGACLLVLSAWAPSRAQDDEYARLVHAAIGAQQAGHYTEARELFAEAHALAPSARSLRGMGVAAFQAGDYTQAVTDLEASLVHPEKPLDDNLRRAVTDLLTRARGFVGRYTFEVTPADATLRVDDRTQPHDREVVLAPGRHRIEVSAPTFVSQDMELSVQSGAHDTLRFSLAPEVAPDASPVLAAPMTPSPTIQSDRRESPRYVDGHEATQARRTRRATWALLGSGAGLALASGSMALIGWRRAEPIDRACRAGCSPEYRARRISQAHLDELEKAVDIVGGAALAALVGSAGTWTWRRYTLSPQASLTQSSTHLGATLVF